MNSFYFRPPFRPEPDQEEAYLDAVLGTAVGDDNYPGDMATSANWPGDGVYPPQPMIAQTRAVLDAYRDRGGDYREAVLDACGHSPHVERPEAFMELLLRHLGAA
jgi:hypothetical protein